MFTVKCFRPHTNLAMGHNFYVLNRGYNSGRPSYSPNPNCFVVSCQTREERDQLFWACKALHLNGVFKQYLVGSVVELIRIKDFTKLLTETHNRFLNGRTDLLVTVKKINAIAALRQKNEKTIELADKLQLAMLSEIFIKQ